MIYYSRVSIMLLIIICTISLCAESYSFVWANQCGNYQTGAESRDLIIDNLGDIVSIGFYSPPATFGNVTFTDGDTFVAKLDTDGNWLWVANAYTSHSFGRFRVCSDSNGDIYIAGSFRGVATFGNFTIVGTNNSYGEIFVAKLNQNGEWLWAQKIGSGFQNLVNDITVDTNNNLLLVGWIVSSCSFGSYTLNRGGLIAKISSNGSLLSANCLGGSSLIGQAIQIDTNGNVYIAGEFTGTDVIGTTIITCNGISDIFVAKYDDNMVNTWVKRAGGTGRDDVCDIAIENNLLYILGNYETDFSYGGDSISNNGLWGTFIVQMSTDSSWNWIRNYDSQLPAGMDSDNNGNCYICGGKAVVNGDSFQFGSYVSKYNNQGDMLWEKITLAPIIRMVKADILGNCYINGEIYRTTIFDTITLTIPEPQWEDVFIAKLVLSSVNTSDELNPPMLNIEAYPNPSHYGSSITFKTNMKKNEQGTLTIYNLRGQVVKNFDIRGEIPSLIWDGKNDQGQHCASGVYFYKLRTNSRVSTNKLVLLK